MHVCGACELVLYCGEACADADWNFVHYSEHEAPLYEANEILPGQLWLGGVESLRNKELMSKVHTVVTAIHLDRVSECALAPWLKGKEHLRISIHDWPTEDIDSHLDEAADFIFRHLKDGVLVHCFGGISRSATIVIYFLWKYGYAPNIDAALKLVRKHRPDVRPNSGFWATLKRRENKNAQMG
jgi:protein-tyrosine phosphatase